MERGLMQIIDLLRTTVSLLFHAWILLCRAGVGGSLVDRHLEELRQVRDGCMGASLTRGAIEASSSGARVASDRAKE